MSETTSKNRPARPQGKQAEQPEGLRQFKADFFRARGWESKTGAQEEMQSQMAASCAAIEAHFNPDPKVSRAVALESADLNPGKEFQAFLTELRAFESAPLPRTNYQVAKLNAAAKAYLDHYEEHFKFQQVQPKTRQKADACREVLSELRGYDLRDQLKQLGDPPWDSEKALKAQELKAMLDLESLPSGKRMAEPLNGGTASATFWINRDTVSNGQVKSALFKPDLGGEPPVNGFPSGGESVREAMAARTGDVLNGITGINFGMPETNIISLDASRLPEGTVSDPSKPVEGSVQQFVASKGEMRDQPLDQKAKIPAKDCQKIAILDTITLNMDRHGGNLMIDDSSGTPSLVPIDHGLTFPPAEARDQLAKRLGDQHNALLGIPASYEPFSPEMLTAIAAIEPGQMIKALKSERDVVASAHPEAAAKLSDEALEASRRSAMFLKLAAPALSPAVVQIALGQHAAELLDPSIDADEFTKRAQAAIEEAKSNGGAYAAYFLMSTEEKGRMEAALVTNGWPNEGENIQRKWMLANMQLALNLYRSNMRNPTLEAIALQTMTPQELTEQLKSRSLFRIASSARPRPAPVQRDASFDGPEAKAELEALNKAFPVLKLTAEKETYVNQMDAWRKLKAKGGMDAVKAAAKTNGLSQQEADRAADSPMAALEFIRNADERGAALLDVRLRDFDPVAMETAAEQQKLQYARDLTALLPTDDADKTLKIVNAIQTRTVNVPAKVRKQMIEDIRTTVFDKVRAHLSERAKLIPKTSPRETDKFGAELWAENLGKVRDYIASGSLTQARDLIETMK